MAFPKDAVQLENAVVRPFPTLKCSKCEIEKAANQFGPDKRATNGKQSSCRACYREWHNGNYDRNRSNLRKEWRDRYRRNPSKFKEKQLKVNYGIDMTDYNTMFSAQQGRCAICKIHQSELRHSLFVDHNHETNKVRGLLCPKCNSAIGFIKEDLEIIKSMECYLRVHNGDS